MILNDTIKIPLGLSQKYPLYASFIAPEMLEIMFCEGNPCVSSLNYIYVNGYVCTRDTIAAVLLKTLKTNFLYA